MIMARCVYCGGYYEYSINDEDPGCCGNAECKTKMENEKSFYAADLRPRTNFPTDFQGDINAPKKEVAKVAKKRGRPRKTNS